MTLSDKAIQEFKDIFKKEYGQELTDAEAREQGERLLGFFDILYKQALREHRRKLRLKKEKINGFFLEDELTSYYTCAICGDNYPGPEIWWNPQGLRCKDCWRNIQNKVIPSLTYDSDNKVWIKEWQLRSDFGIHPATRGKLRRQGLLNGRDLKREDGSIYCTVYLVKENQKFLKKYKRKPRMRVKFVNPKKKKKSI
jgi:DNA-directed RNA polymerase subunit RPC12/RpoP